MKRVILKCGIIFLLTIHIFGQKGQDEVRISAKNGDSVMIVGNNIKFEKKQEFDDILFNEVMPAVLEYRDPDDEKHKLNEKSFDTWRIFRPTEMNDDSTWTFIVMADPFVDGSNYLITNPLIQKYGEKGADEVFERWSNCFKGGQSVFVVQQSEY